ncbi:MAG: bifunctional folylpolyglutamate synthase/dihydrofolate synthase [Eubacterium sp.]
MEYSEAINLILNKQSLGIKPGLNRVLALLSEMDNPQDKINIIHIAGTNGKGTVAKTIADTLFSNGKRVGLFTSPWIVDYREQIQINNEFISRFDFANYVSQYKNNDCTEFEMLVAIMYKYFADNNVDYAVIECGMGGRGDATNVEKENVCSVITSVSIDHTSFLGNTVDEIKVEKLGISRKNSPCFDYEDYAEDLDFNVNNLNLAKAVVDYLGYNSDIKLSRLPARQQKIGNILIDGGHNISAAEALSNIIDNETAVIGMMEDKDIEGYLKLVAPKCKRIIATTPNNPRSMQAEKLSAIAKKYCNDVISINNPMLAVKEKDVSLICGSFYLARDIINLI